MLRTYKHVTERKRNDRTALCVSRIGILCIRTRSVLRVYTTTRRVDPVNCTTEEINIFFFFFVSSKAIYYVINIKAQRGKQKDRVYTII